MEESQLPGIDAPINNNNSSDVETIPNLDGVGDKDAYSNKNGGGHARTEPHRCSDICKGVCVPFTSIQNAARTYSNLYSLFQSGQFCDATLKTEDGSTLPVHSIVICGDSDYFRALFTTPLHATTRPKEFLIKGISGEMLKTLLDFLYTRTIYLAEENVTSILEAADYLGIVALKKICCEFIESQISATNCLGIRSFAASMFCTELEQKAHKYLMKNFVDVAAHSDELLELTAEQAIQIFGNDELNVKSEELVWDAILRWISHKPEERRDHIVDLIVQVRTGLMETQYFMEHVKDHPYVHGNEGCRPIVIETLRFLYDLEVVNTREVQVHVATPNIARPRIPHEVLFAIGGWSGGTPTNYIETYDTRADRWIMVSEVDATGPRAYHGTVVIGPEIIVIGGFDGNEYFNTTRAFNTITKTWRSLAPMHTKRCYVSVALLHGKYIYAMGGYDGHHRQNTVEKYDSETNQWSMVAPMNAQRSDACATELNGKIYITGGFSGTECLLSAEVYDPVLNRWTAIASMRNRRSGVSCISYHGSVYVLGGFNGIARMASVEKYNPITDAWSTVPDMYNPRSNFAVEVIDDMIFCIGGFNGATTIYHVECYDDRTNEWFEATDMNIYRSALSACVVSDLPNISDYIHQHRDRLMEERRQRLFSVNQTQNAAARAAPQQ